MKLYIGILITLITFNLFAQAPSWVKSGKHNSYPEEFYWYAVGHAPAATGGIDAAKNNARMEIASQLKVTVSGSLSTTLTEKIYGENSDISSTAKKDIESVVDNMELPALKIVETYFSKVEDEYYVFAVINKEEFFTSLENQLSTTIRTAKDKLENAKKYINNGDIISALNSYKEVLNLSNEMYPKILFYNSLAEKGILLPEEVRYDNVLKDVMDFLGKVKIEIISGDNQEGQIGKMASGPIILRAKYENIPLSATPITFKAGNTIIGTKPTNEEGVVEYNFTFNGDGLIDNSNGQIVAYITFSNIPSNIRKKLESTSFATIKYKVVRNRIITSKIEIQGDYLDKDKSIIYNKVVKSLENNGVNINQTTPGYATKVVISESQVNENKTNSGKLYIVKLDVNISIVDLSNNTIVGSVTYNLNGADKTKEKAINRALNSLKISNNDIGKIISGI